MKTRKNIFQLSLIAIIIALGTGVFLIKKKTNDQLSAVFPLNNSLFPADFAPPTFIWNDLSKNNIKWKIIVKQKGKGEIYSTVVDRSQWRTDSISWEKIKFKTNFRPFQVIVERFNETNKGFFVPKAIFQAIISSDSVKAPILYREIPLPMVYAEKHIGNASYDLFSVSNTQNPQRILDQFPVCSNCHSSTTDGRTLALDFDAVTRDKGGYFIADIDSEIVFNKYNYLSWSKMQGKSTFGLFSKISPTGRYVLTTIRDRVISKKFESPDSIAYSQLFFPVNGILAVYDRQTKEFHELPGANDTSYVQSNPFWSPDEKYIYYARAKALPYSIGDAVYMSFLADETIVNEYVNGKREIKFDIYRVPFNEGKGGKAEPVEGASNNNKSNYFPAISPDGKWLVFCQSKRFMMLQPDSRLYIIPSSGGKAKALECNFKDMNSWHAWSPNGKWLVFATKAMGIYTDMFLTHIDEKGRASIPVLLENAKRKGNAINYPEFLNIDPTRSVKMKYDYVNSIFIYRALKSGKTEEAKALLKKYINQGQMYIPTEYEDVGNIYMRLQMKDSAQFYFNKAKEAERNFYKAF